MTFAEFVKHYGGLSAAARALGVPQSTANEWRGGIPKGRQFEIAVRTNGVLRVDDKYMRVRRVG